MNQEDAISQVLTVLPEIGKRLHASVAAHPEAAGRSIGQIRAMVHLFHHGSSTVGDGAAALGVAMPTMSELIDRLVEDGMVERGVNPDDRRQVIVSLTPRARAFGDRIYQLRRAQVKAALDRLEPHEWPMFVRSIQALADALAEGG
ncbi:MAG TPA: MarR family transcriptional regulator [Thermomicrobiales bacterium]|nr:MarR family transcriptional regulator [Thermomicrobiales bacterium]